MKTLSLIALLALFSIGCRKETNPPPRCFSYSQWVDFDTTYVVDSIIVIATSHEKPTVTRRVPYYYVKNTFVSGFEQCGGLFDYRIEVWNSNPDHPVSIRLTADMKEFDSKTITGTGVIEGTYVYR